MNEKEELKQSIFNFFEKQKSKTYAYNQLLKLFNVTKKEEPIFNEALRTLQIQGKVLFTNSKKYTLFPFNTSLVTGKIKYDNTDGYYVLVNNKKIFIPNYLLNGALEKDYCLINKNYKDKNNQYGEVKSIIYRKKDEYIFDYIYEDGKTKLVPYSFAFPYKINLKNIEKEKLVVGERVSLVLEKLDNNTYTAYVKDYIGHVTDPDFEIKTIAKKFDIELDIPQNVLKEVQEIKQYVTEKEMQGRTDLRDKRIVTLDGVDTKDIDDSFLVTKNLDTYTLLVSIADVSHYVKYGSKIYEDAKNRGNSYYPANFVIPMLHHLLSNGICSLNENVDRLTLSVSMTINKKGQVIDYNIFEGVINSKKKMSYEDVNKIFDGEIIPGYEPFINDLEVARELGEILNNVKCKRGYIDMGENEISSSKEEDNITIKSQERGIAEHMIEDFMLLANETIAKYAFSMSLPFIYRVHEKPDKEKVKEVLQVIKNMGYDIKVHHKLDTNYAMQEIMEQVSKLPEASIISLMILQTSMKRAIYTKDKMEHFGLALKNYTHYTSPIRRFIDLIVHMLIKKNLHGEVLKDQEELLEELTEICNHCNQTNKNADDFERAVNNMLIMEYLEQNTDKIFNVIIVNINSNTITVKTDNEIYGKIYIDSLTEKYNYDSKKKSLYHGNDTLNVGDTINVVVKKLDKEHNKITFKYLNKVLENETNTLKRIRK